MSACIEEAIDFKIMYLETRRDTENNEADYHSHYLEPQAAQESQTSKKQAEFELRLEEFEKDIRAILRSSVPEAVTWPERLEKTH